MKAEKTHFRLKDWKRVTKRHRQACRMLAVCAAAFILSCILSAAVVYSEVKRMQNPIRKPEIAEPERPAQEQIPFETVTPAVPVGRIPEQEDAGQEYLDETVFIGDSNTVRMFVYGLVPLENYMAVEGIGIESIGQASCVYFKDDPKAYTVIEAIGKVKPRRIVMTFGTNNADGNFSKEEFIGLYRDAVEQIRKINPDSTIIINSIPPLGRMRAYPNLDQNTLDEFNAALLELAKELELPYLDTAQELKGKDGYIKPEFVVEDGLHLSKAALETVLDYTRTHPDLSADRRTDVKHPPERRAAPGLESFVQQ